MSRMVRIRTVCDGCAVEGTDNDVDTATYGPVEGKTVDLCPRHHDTLWEPFARFVALHGTPVGKVPRGMAARSIGPALDAARAHVAAPRQGKKTRRSGVKERARRAAAEVAAPPSSGPKGAGFPCPLCARVSPTTNALQVHMNTSHGVTPSAVYGGTCPLCNHAGTGQGLGTHARMAHRVEGGVPGLFRDAKAAGDPYGVIAARADAVAAMVGATG